MRIDMISKLINFLIFSLFYLFVNVSQAEQLSIANFSNSSLEGWEENHFQVQPPINWFR